MPGGKKPITDASPTQDATVKQFSESSAGEVLEAERASAAVSGSESTVVSECRFLFRLQGRFQLQGRPKRAPKCSYMMAIAAFVCAEPDGFNVELAEKTWLWRIKI